MKRLIVVLCVVGFLAALPLSHVAAKGPAPKVDICHVTDSAVVNAAGVSVVVGHVITVSENSKDAHVAHGDILVINDIDSPSGLGPTWRFIADLFEVNTAGANCAGFRLP